jgi:deoxyribodipyrimidine photolyase
LNPQIPVFVWAPEEEGQFQPGRYSRWWLKHTVILFAKAIEGLGSQLVVRRATETGKCLVQMVKVGNGWLRTPAGVLAVLQHAGATQQDARQCKCFLVVVAWLQETGAKAVYFNHLYDPISLMRDHEVKGVGGSSLPEPFQCSMVINNNDMP